MLVFDASRRPTRRSLAGMLATLESDGRRLQDMCERYMTFVDKLVLHGRMPAAGVRIRLHLYRAGYFDPPPQPPLVLRQPEYCAGTNTHRIFGDDRELTQAPTPAASGRSASAPKPPAPPTPCTTHSVHTVQAAADTISLSHPWPAAKERVPDP